MDQPQGENSRGKFYFGLVCKVIVEVQILKKFFSLAWVGHMAKKHERQTFVLV